MYYSTISKTWLTVRPKLRDDVTTLVYMLVRVQMETFKGIKDVSK